MFQEIQSLLPGRISIRRGRSKLLHPLAMQEKWRKMFLILRCSVPPEIMTGFCLPCFVRFYCTVNIKQGKEEKIVYLENVCKFSLCDILFVICAINTIAFCCKNIIIIQKIPLSCFFKIIKKQKEQVVYTPALFL